LMLVASQSSHSLDVLALASVLLAIAAGALAIVTIGIKYYGQRRGRRTPEEKTLAETLKRQFHSDTRTEHHETPNND
jgi:hypothetical protein